MKFTTEVVAAFAVLREHADNDFERHRIDALERDLTAPPVVEVIDDTHQRFNSVTYKKGTDNHFKAGKGIHRDVWVYFNGEIPEGHEIHHIDGNPENNAIDNLQCLTKAEHRELHAPEQIPMPKKVFTCDNCGQKYRARDTKNNRFCSLKCNHEFHSVTKTCPVCGKTFKSYKYDNQTFCSRKCMHEYRTIAATEERICPVCGASFTAKKSSPKIYCSRQCGRKNRNKS